MRRAIGIVLTLAALLPAGFIARRSAHTSLDALRFGDRAVAAPPEVNVPPQPPVGALSGSVALIVAGGLTDATSWRIPALQYLRSRGASGVMRAETPTLGPAAWASMLTHLPADRHRVILASQLERPLRPDNLLREAKRAGLTTAVAAPAAWQRWIGEDTSYFSLIDGADGLSGSAWSRQPNLFVAYLPELDRAGHEHGVGTGAYLDAAGRLGEGLFTWLAALDLSRTTVVVVGDHGARADGGHGGDEPDVARVPVVAAGRGIQPGARTPPIEQRDVAALVARLLGLPPLDPDRPPPPGYLQDGRQAPALPERGGGLDRAGATSPIERLLTRLDDPGLRMRAPTAAAVGGGALLALALAAGTGPWARSARAGLVTTLLLLALLRLGLQGVGPFARIEFGFSLSDVDPHAGPASVGRQWAFEYGLALLGGATVAAVRAARLDRPPGAAVAALCAALSALGAFVALPGYLVDGLTYEASLPSVPRTLWLHGGLLLIQVAAGLCPAWMFIGARAGGVARRAGERDAPVDGQPRRARSRTASR